MLEKIKALREEIAAVTAGSPEEVEALRKFHKYDACLCLCH